VLWTPDGAEHIRTRSVRYDRPHEFNVEPEWATEAALDRDRQIAATGGKSISVIGKAHSAPSRIAGELGRVLKVWLIPIDLMGGHWLGASACEANEKERRLYGQGSSQ
jgi:hypothetical protein